MIGKRAQDSLQANASPYGASGALPPPASWDAPEPVSVGEPDAHPDAAQRARPDAAVAPNVQLGGAPAQGVLRNAAQVLRVQQDAALAQDVQPGAGQGARRGVRRAGAQLQAALVQDGPAGCDGPVWPGWGALQAQRAGAAERAGACCGVLAQPRDARCDRPQAVWR